jgi:hypothetical protein
LRDPRRELASASAARLSGDDYQHLYTWMQAVRLLREDVWGVKRVMMEVDKAGNVDDLIIAYVDRPALYHQIKFSRLAGEPLEHEWFTDFAGARRSPLQRFYRSFVELTKDDVRPQMALVTNRTIAPDDPILRHVEGRDGLLTPRLARAAASSESGKQRAAWAQHLEISEAELLELLDHLRVQAGAGSLEQLRDSCSQAMLAVGLRGDEEAVTIGHGAIRELIESGCDQLDAAAVRGLIEEHGLAGTRPLARLHVAAIDRAPFPDAATVAVDWVDRYEGSEPRNRRRLLNLPDAAPEMSAELREARRALESSGYGDLRIDGAFRLDVGFAVGAEFADTAGFRVSIEQRGELWESDAEATPFPLQASERGIESGDDLAVCLSISNEIAPDVSAFLQFQGLPVGQILVLTPQEGPDRAAISSPAEAEGCAQAALDLVRAHVGGAEQAHLFLSCPNGLAVLLGHVWNRVPPTRVYADLSPGYQPTFQVLG